MKEFFNKYKLTMILIFIGMIVGGLIIELFNYFGVIRISSKNIASYKGGKVTVNDLYNELRSSKTQCYSGGMYLITIPF